MQHSAPSPNKIKVIEPFLLFLLIGASIIYFVNVLNSGNWAWFMKTAVNVTPSRIIIIDHGEKTVLLPGHANFSTLATAAETSLSKLGNNDLVSIGLSEQTQLDYATESIVLELHFDSPVIFNSAARTGEPTQLLIPIEGRHSKGGYVFRGTQGTWWHGAVRMADPAPLFTALEQLGIIASAEQPAG